jgi:hypothetical protein
LIAAVAGKNAQESGKACRVGPDADAYVTFLDCPE